MLAAYELPLAGPGALPGGVGGPAPGALALAAPPTTELDHLVGVGVGVAPSAPGLLLQGVIKRCRLFGLYMSERLERKRQNARGAGSHWLRTVQLCAGSPIKLRYI
jgi:hypothetical protein